MYEKFIDSFLLLGLLSPLLLSLMLSVKSIRNIVLPLSAWAALPALFAAMFVSPNILYWDVPWLLLGIRVGLDTTGALFLLGSALLWLVAGIYTKAYFLQQKQRVYFYRFFLLAMVGNFGLIASQDIFSFYFFFTLMSFTSYGLIVFKGGKEAFHAGFVYIVLVVLGEVMLFIAFLLLSHATNAISFEAIRVGFIESPNKDLILFLLFIAFGIKAGILGLHVWLPLAHPVAPTPASAVLSGAMIKAGLLGWLRFFPLGEYFSLHWAIGIILLGLFAQFYGVIIGLTQRNPKTLLAYSSISQMGIMTMLIGFGFYLPQHWNIIVAGITFFTLHHGLSKGALFLGVGMLGSTNKLQRYAIWFGLFIPAFALAAAPYSSGMVAKYMVKSYTIYLMAPWSGIVATLLVIGAINTTLLMIRLLYLVRPTSSPFGVTASFSLLWPWTLLLVVILSLAFLFDFSLKVMQELNVLDFLYPLLISFGIAFLSSRVKIFQNIQPISAGDILIFYDKIVILLMKSTRIFKYFLYYYNSFHFLLALKFTKFFDKIVAWLR